jgi:hypothetical protein
MGKVEDQPPSKESAAESSVVLAEGARERIRRSKEREAARSITRENTSNSEGDGGDPKPSATDVGRSDDPQLSDGSDRETASPMPSSEKSNVSKNIGTTKPGAIASSSAYPTASGKNTGPRLTNVQRDAVASSSGDSLIDGADTKTPGIDDSSIAEEPGAVRMNSDGKADDKSEFLKADSLIELVAMLVNEDDDVATLKESIDEHTKEMDGK